MKKIAFVAALAALAVGTPNVEAGLFGNDCCYSDSCCDGKFTVGAEWLYWKVEEDNLDGAIAVDVSLESERVDQTTFYDNSQNLEYINPSFKWDSGFRVFAGYEFCDCWELGVIYSYLPSHASTGTFTRASGDSENNVIGFNSFEFPVLNTAGLIPKGEGDDLIYAFDGKWDFNSNCIDVDLTKTICFGECLRLRPHAGFRAFWFDQKLKLNLARTNNNEEFLFEDAAAATLKQTLRGYGVEGGLWGEYSVGCGLSIVGHVGGAILYTKSTVKQNVIGAFFIAGSSTDDEGVYESRNNYTDKIGIPMLDTFLGLQYADCVCDMQVFGRIGWESHVVYDANRLAIGHGNITAQGLTLGLGVGF